MVRQVPGLGTSGPSGEHQTQPRAHKVGEELAVGWLLRELSAGKGEPTK